MKFLLLALFVAIATSSPLPDGGPVDVIVNGVPEGAALDLSGIVDVKVQKHVEGIVVAAMDPLHPFTAVGIAEAAAAATPEVIPAEPEVIPESVALPEPVAPEFIPEPIVLPAPAAPEVVPDAGVLPEPAAPELVPEVVIPETAAPESFPQPVGLPEAPQPEAVALPEPAVPEFHPAPAPEEVPAPAAQLPNGELYNDGLVSVNVNGPQEPGLLSYLQSWFSMALNYINSSGVQTTHQIV